MLKKNLFYNALLSVSQFIFPLITFPYSSRILGPNGIGSINFIDSFTQYFILFAALGIPLYGVREISKLKGNEQKLNKTFNEIFVIHLISAAVFSIIYLISALLIPNLWHHFDLVLVGIAMIIFGVLSAEWVFQGLEQFAYITSRTLLVRFLSVAFLFLFLKTNSPPIIYYSILSGSVVLNGIINIVYIRKFIKIDFKQLDLKKHIKPLFIILGSTLAVSVYLLMDNVLLGFIQSEKAVGIYATALRIVRLPLALIGALNSVIIPRMSRAYEKQDFDQIRSVADKSFSLICIIVFPIVTGIYVSSAFLIHTFAGNKFNNSIVSLQILAPLVLIIGMANLICLQLLAPMGKERILLKVYLLSMVFSLITNVYLIQRYSYMGASVGMILTEFFATILAFYFLKRTIRIDFDKGVFFKCLVGSLAFFPIAYIIRNSMVNGILKETLVILICGLFYVFYVLVFLKNTIVDDFKKIIYNKFSFK